MPLLLESGTNCNQVLVVFTYRLGCTSEALALAFLCFHFWKKICRHVPTVPKGSYVPEAI